MSFFVFMSTNLLESSNTFFINTFSVFLEVPIYVYKNLLDNEFCQWHSLHWSDSGMHFFPISKTPTMRIFLESSGKYGYLGLCVT